MYSAHPVFTEIFFSCYQGILRESNSHQDEMEVDSVSDEQILKYVDAVTQTNSISCLESVFSETVIFCDRTSINSVGTYCYVYSGVNRKEASTMTTCREVVSTRDIAVGSNIEEDFNKVSCSIGISNPTGFSGITDIHTDIQMKQLAGVSTTTFQLLFSKIQETLVLAEPTSKYKVCPKNRLLLFLMRLKLGLDLTVLAGFFSIHNSSASRIFRAVLQAISLTTKNWLYWPSKKAVEATLPESFYEYPNCRAIIDCTEFRCETPPSVSDCVFTYSNYKGCHTLKILIAGTPNGLISFISKAYGGKASDCFITQDSGFLDLLEPGDLVLADKGFPQIMTDVSNQCSILVMPPFSKGHQFSKEEVQETYNIARVRIHIERLIQRLKTYKILDKIAIDLFPYIDDLFHVICVLTNFQKPIIK